MILFFYYKYVILSVMQFYLEARHDGNRNSIQIGTSEDKKKDNRQWHMDKLGMWICNTLLLAEAVFSVIFWMSEGIWFVLCILPVVIVPSLVRFIIFDAVNNIYMGKEYDYVGVTAPTDTLISKLKKKSTLIIRIIAGTVIIVYPALFYMTN